MPAFSVTPNRSASASPRRALVWVLALGLLVAVPLTVLGVGIGSKQPAAASVGGTVMPLQEFANDGSGGRLWNSYNQSVGSEGPTTSGRPSPLREGEALQVFARSATGELIEFTNDDAGGRLWNSSDVTQLLGGPAITDDPAAILVNGTMDVFAETSNGDLVEFTASSASPTWREVDLSESLAGATLEGDPDALVVGSAIDVFARAASGDLVELTNANGAFAETDLSQVAGGQVLGGDPDAILYGSSSVHVYGVAQNGDLTEFVNDGAGGRAWNAYDLTKASGGPSITGRPSPVAYGATVHVETRSTGGQLIEFVNDGADRRLWNAYDLTSISGGPTIVSDPGAVLYGTNSLHIYAEATDGDLVETVNDGLWGRTWNYYDLTQISTGPSVGTAPSPIVYGSSVHVYAAGPNPPAVVQQIVETAQAADQHNAAVIETPPGSNCNSYTAYWARGVSTGCAAGTSAEEWCSDFAQWVWAAVGIDTTGINGWSFTFVDWGESHTGAWFPGATNDPQPGDAVVWGDMASAYGAHIGIVVGVSQGQIDVVSGNSGPPIDAQGDVGAVWDSGYFDPTTSTVDGYPILGYVSPTGWSGYTGEAPSAHARSTEGRSSLIASQDGGK